MTHPLIEVKALSVAFGTKKVLNDLNFAIQKGDIVAVIGPNGSGKTTLVQALLGLIHYKGDILIKGKRALTSLGQVGYVPQRFEFDRTIPLTVSEFLTVAYPKATSKSVKVALLEVDMKGSESRQLGSLSAGELQRILIARALVHDPALLILDEATSAVDMPSAKSFYDIVTHLKQVHGTTVLLISHEINMVYQYADRIICLNQDLICYGKPEEAISTHVLERLYGKDVRFQKHDH